MICVNQPQDRLSLTRPATTADRLPMTPSWSSAVHLGGGSEAIAVEHRGPAAPGVDDARLPQPAHYPGYRLLRGADHARQVSPGQRQLEQGAAVAGTLLTE